ncbi:MAG: hypothetical protein GXP63_01705 [DPANN group archaeon]|nr:hypothetical protein [DPANN group archaeon]
MLALVILSYFAFAVPTQPTAPETLDRRGDSRLDPTNYPAKSLEAEAGNITGVYIFATTQTKTWAGFYGNISGNITLDDAVGNTFYDWEVAEPNGEVYAANDTVSDWSTIRCINFSATPGMTVNYDGGLASTVDNNPLNLSLLENGFGITWNDEDGVNETFNTGTHDGFFVGTINITENSCMTTDTYQDSHSAGDAFQEVLLEVNNSNTVIFSTIIENRDATNETDVRGYNGARHDFQMLVLEDGHDGPEADLTTTYYFYVELD